MAKHAFAFSNGRSHWGRIAHEFLRKKKIASSEMKLLKTVIKIISLS